MLINSKLGGLRGGEAARPREPAALRVAARVEPGRAEPRVPLRHLGALIHQKSFLNTNYFFNFFLSGKFITFIVVSITIFITSTHVYVYSIGSLHLRGDLERLEGPGGRVRHRRVPRGRAEAVQGGRAFRPGPRCTPRPGRGPPAGTLSGTCL